MSTILFEKMIQPNVKKYQNMLENMYYQKVLQLQFLIKDDEFAEAELQRINIWYQRELMKCQQTEKN